jgi:hypothetical protein
LAPHEHHPGDLQSAPTGSGYRGGPSSNRKKGIKMALVKPEGMNLKAVEIRVVANGYWVCPSPWSGKDPTQYLNEKEIYVFQTFTDLTDWLRDQLEKKFNER